MTLDLKVPKGYQFADVIFFKKITVLTQELVLLEIPLGDGFLVSIKQ